MSVRWLHLTDLHVGMSGMSPLWPTVEAEFWADLERLHAVAGGIDVVFFTGDLTFSGKQTEFAKLNDWLEDLVTRLRALGSDPVLLPVPGNHDLARPDESKLAIRALLNWKNDQDLRTSFWEDRGRDDRGLVNSVFEEYRGWVDLWQSRHPFPEWVSLTGHAGGNPRTPGPGLLTGDFAATIRRGGLSLGVVGLNSAFLHLNGRVVRGQIALHPHQLQAVCEGNPDAWARRHDVCFLLTHHPPDWLTPDALAFYQGAILRPEWFAGHLCGHLHEPVTLIQSFGGAPAHRLFQGASLFGLDVWADAEGKHEQRIHGYSVGVLEREDGRGRLRVFPRSVRRHAGNGRWRMIPDHDHFDLTADAFDVELPLRATPAQTPAKAPPLDPLPSSSEDGVSKFAPAIPAPVVAPRVPQPPGLGYDPAWYVPRAAQEQLALDVLRHPHASVVLTAPHASSKSTVLRRLVELLREDDTRSRRLGLVIALDLGRLGDGALNDAPTGFRELAQLLVEGVEKALEAAGKAAPRGIRDWVGLAWQRPMAPERQLDALLVRRVLPLGAERVVLVFDRFDRIVGKPLGNPVSRLLRQWMEERQDAALAPLRLLLAAAGVSLFFEAIDDVSDFFNLTLQVRLDNFRLPELQQLARLYEREWSREDLELVLELVDGHPYLSRLILFLEACGTPKDELLDVERLKLDHCAGILRQLWLHHQNRPDVLQPLCVLLKDPKAKLPAAQSNLLYQAGLVRRVDGAFWVTNQLVASYFRERC